MNNTDYDVITKRTLPLFCICIITLLLSACYTARAPIADTQSKRPEITTSASIEAIKKELMTQMTNDGAILTSSDEGLLVFEREADAASQFWFHNVETGERPRVRYRVNTVDMGDARRVIMSMFFQRPGGRNKQAFETETFSPENNQKMQALLERVKTALEQRAATTTKKKTKKKNSQK